MPQSDVRTIELLGLFPSTFPRALVFIDLSFLPLTINSPPCVIFLFQLQFLLLFATHPSQICRALTNMDFLLGWSLPFTSCLIRPTFTSPRRRRALPFLYGPSSAHSPLSFFMSYDYTLHHIRSLFTCLLPTYYLWLPRFSSLHALPSCSRGASRRDPLHCPFVHALRDLPASPFCPVLSPYPPSHRPPHSLTGPIPHSLSPCLSFGMSFDGACYLHLPHLRSPSLRLRRYALTPSHSLLSSRTIHSLPLYSLHHHSTHRTTILTHTRQGGPLTILLFSPDALFASSFHVVYLFQSEI